MLYMPPSNCKDKKSASLSAGQIAFRYLTLIEALQMAQLKPMQLKSITACLSVILNLFYLGYPLYLPFQAPHSNGHETDQTV